MCWASKEIPKAKIAEEDIKTLKVLTYGSDNELYAYFYFYYFYLLGIIQPKINIEIVNDTFKSYIFNGYHSYHRNHKYEIFMYNSIVDYNKKCFGISIESINYPNPRHSRVCVAECIIPKKTKYYLNKIGEYVSEQIIVDKILEITPNNEL